MSFLRVVFILFLLSLGALIGWGNRSVLLSMTVLGSPVPPLPLGVLILGSVVLGLCAGLLLQILLRRRRRSALSQSRRSPSSKAEKPKAPWFNKGKKAAKPSAAKSKTQRSKTQASRRPSSASDWDDQPVVDWFGNPTRKADASPEDRRRNPARDPQPPRRRNASSDRVVDANYRVITPPSGGRTSRQATPRNPNDEWDDEFFE